MAELASQFGVWALVGAFAVVLVAGFVKGAVGFALPMIAVSGVGSMMSADVAIAAIILPGLATNLAQSLRGGGAAFVETFVKYWRLNVTMFLLIGLFAQLVVVLPGWALFAVLGVTVTGTGLLQLGGWRPHWAPRHDSAVQFATGGLAGVFGGLTGAWGPPVLLYLVARDTPKAEMVRAQGIVFLLGSIILIGAHLVSGLLDRDTVPFSAALVIPAVGGLLLGRLVQDRLDQAKFRKLTLFVLVLAGLNLLRRAAMVY